MILLPATVFLAALSYDLQNVPRDVMHRRLASGPDKP